MTAACQYLCDAGKGLGGKGGQREVVQGALDQADV